jgi:hypothetical protein
MGELFCNLTKAFDSLNHTVLLSKLEFYGINGKLIKSYLNDIYQRTLMNNNYSLGTSEWQKVKVCHKVQYFVTYCFFYTLMICLI